jgi:pimeloyl-ACP methyl ester carboxylesterase
VPGADDRNGVRPLEERTAEIKDVRLRYYVGGDGPPLLLVHGLAGAASNWTEVVPRLARSFRLLVPDLPGHAGSTAFPAVTSLDPFADRLARLAALEEMESLAVVGHSLGGLIGLRLAVNFPKQVPALVLTAAAGIRSSTREAERYLAAAALLRPSRRYSRHRYAIAQSRLLRTIVFGYFGASDPAALSDEAVDGLLAGLAVHTDTASARRALVRDDPRLDLARVACPVYLLWGARDNQVTVDDAFEYARRLHAPLRMISDCGHLLIAERPDACARAIEDFLLRPGSGARRTPTRARTARPASRRAP